MPLHWLEQGSFVAVLAVSIFLSIAQAQYDYGGNNPGSRASGCAFVYNNTFYVFGGEVTSASTLYPAAPFTGALLPLYASATTESRPWKSISLPTSWGWNGTQTPTSTNRFDCVCNKDGKMFIFGGPIRFAIYDFKKPGWILDQQPKFAQNSISDLENQRHITAALHPDGYNISIVASSSNVYMKMDTKTMFIQTRALENFQPGSTGFCMGVISTTSEPVVCGGSPLGASCYKLSLGNGATAMSSLSSAQSFCRLLPYADGFILIPGFLESYRARPPNNFMMIDSFARYSDSVGAWYNITTLDNTLSARWAAQTAVIPGTTIAIVYSGLKIYEYKTDLDIRLLNMANGSWAAKVERVPSEYVPTPVPEKEGSNIAAVVGGSVAAFVVLTVAVVYLARRKNADDPSKSQDASNSPDGGQAVDTDNTAGLHKIEVTELDLPQSLPGGNQSATAAAPNSIHPPGQLITPQAPSILAGPIHTTQQQWVPGQPQQYYQYSQAYPGYIMVQPAPLNQQPLAYSYPTQSVVPQQYYSGQPVYPNQQPSS